MLQKLKAQNSNLKTTAKILKVLSFTLLLYALTFTLFALPVYAACDATELAKPVEERSADCPAGLDQIEQIMGNVISVIVGLGFVAMLVLLVMAGLKYLTSGGEPKAIQSAHYTLTWALLGVVFMAVAWLILQLIESFTGIKVTIFDIKALCGVAGDPLKFCR